jgi:hypothetical protein
MDNQSADECGEAPACHHMQQHVHALADDTLKGPLRWYTQMHCSYCKRCGGALRTLRDAGMSAPNPDADPV